MEMVGYQAKRGRICFTHRLITVSIFTTILRATHRLWDAWKEVITRSDLNVEMVTLADAEAGECSPQWCGSPQMNDFIRVTNDLRFCFCFACLVCFGFYFWLFGWFLSLWIETSLLTSLSGFLITGCCTAQSLRAHQVVLKTEAFPGLWFYLIRSYVFVSCFLTQNSWSYWEICPLCENLHLTHISSKF